MIRCICKFLNNTRREILNALSLHSGPLDLIYLHCLHLYHCSCYQPCFLGMVWLA